MLLVASHVNKTLRHETLFVPDSMTKYPPKLLFLHKDISIFAFLLPLMLKVIVHHYKATTDESPSPRAPTDVCSSTKTYAVLCQFDKSRTRIQVTQVSKRRQRDEIKHSTPLIILIWGQQTLWRWSVKCLAIVLNQFENWLPNLIWSLTCTFLFQLYISLPNLVPYIFCSKHYN